MRKLWLINLGLLVAVLSLATLALLAPDQKPRRADYPSLTALPPENARHIRIERRDGDVVELARDAQGVWRVTAPLRLPANKFRVQSVLQVLSARSYQQLDVGQVALKDFQLDPPNVRLIIDDVQLAYGDIAPLTAQRYVQLGGTVHLLPDTQFTQLTAEAASFADLAPLGADPQPVDIQTPAYRLVKQADGKWELSPPPSQAISADSLNSLVEEWKRLQAFSVRAYQPKPDAPQESVSVLLDGQAQPLRLLISGRQPELVLAAPERGVQYHLPGERAATLLELPKPPPETPAAEIVEDLPPEADGGPEEVPDFDPESVTDAPRGEE